VPSISSDHTSLQIAQVLSVDLRRTIFNHKQQWSNLIVAKSLTWDMFPWPVLSKVLSEQEITQSGVEAYLESTFRSPWNTFQTTEEHVMSHIHSWDYNRMDGKVFGRVQEDHLEVVKRGVIRVGSVLQSILIVIRQ
jgi:hypothetical protein